MTAAEFLSAALLTVAAFGLLYLALATICVLRKARLASAPTLADCPGVTLLKPLHGTEPGLFENLASFCRQDYPGRVQIVFGVQSASDPAIPVVRQLQVAFPDVAIRLIVDGTIHGTNRKVSNLINMEREIRHDVVVMSDSDMAVPSDYLARIVAELNRPAVGAVTCLYHGVPVEGVWSQLAALGIDTHFLPSVAVGTSLGMAKPCFGSTVAFRRETLVAIGGFRSVADELADDYMIGAAVRGLGLAVSVPAFTIGHTFAERSLRALVRQELRWARTIRRVDPVGHAGSVVSHPLPFALGALLLDPGVTSFLFVALAIAMRLLLCLAVERGFGVRRHPYRLVPVRDLLSFGILVASFLGRGVSWRGHRYSVAPSGVLIAGDEA